MWVERPDRSIPSRTNRTPGSPWAPGGAGTRCRATGAGRRTRRRATGGQRQQRARPPRAPDATRTPGAARGSRITVRVAPRTRRRPAQKPLVGGQQAFEELAVGGRDGLGADRRRPGRQRPGQGGGGLLAVVQDEVRRRREPVQRGRPRRVEAARDLARDSGPGVPVGQHDVAAGERLRAISTVIRSAASDAARSAATRGVSDLPTARRAGGPGDQPRRLATSRGGPGGPAAPASGRGRRARPTCRTRRDPRPR